MGVYFAKHKKWKGWRYDFNYKGKRYTKAPFTTKTQAKQAEAEKRKEIKNLNSKMTKRTTLTDTVFYLIVNERLDYLKDFKTEGYYNDTLYMARRWVNLWGTLNCVDITHVEITKYLRERKKISSYSANAEIRALRALFNFAKKKKMISCENLMNDIEFFPVEKIVKYVPTIEEIDAVISVGSQEEQDYLWTIRETFGRKSEIDRMEWERDVNFNDRYVVLYTRKKKGGHLTPRKIPMSKKLYEVLSRRHENRDEKKPWVFWHRYWSRKANKFVEGPYKDRKTLMKKLCAKAGVRYFRYHPIRHSGATIMDSNNVPIGSIQRILGHENRTTTEIYLHSIGDEERNAINVYENVRNNSHKKSHTKQKRGQRFTR